MGLLHDVSGLRIVDQNVLPVPAQFSVLNRYWARGGSSRHVSAIFDANVRAYSGPGTGKALYRLTVGSNPKPSSPVRVADQGGEVRITTGVHSVAIDRSPFSITLRSGSIDAIFRDENNDLRPTFARPDVTVEVEERGPIRAVVRMSARATGHAIHHALQAYRVTGDTELLDLVGNDIRAQVEPRLNSVDAYDDGGGSVASWQVGYLSRSIIDDLEELPGGAVQTRDPAAFDVLRRMIQWNVAIANFDTWRDVDDMTPHVSSGTGVTLVDPQA